MLNREKDGLVIFDDFVVDKQLPKFKSISTEIVSRISNGAIGFSDGFTSISMTVDGGGAFAANSLVVTPNKPPSLISRLIKLLTPRENPKLSISDFFKHIKNTSEEIHIIENRQEAYIKAIDNAKKFGQLALVEKLERGVGVARQESQLLALGFDKIISEEQIVKFYKESTKGLQLSWIKNYARLIPLELLEIKIKCDDLNIFDNYLVLYYDPHRKAFMMTEKEKKDSKDPILFGVLKDSRKLYYLGDWIDECCDLTIEAFIDKFGEDAIEKISNEVKVKCK